MDNPAVLAPFLNTMVEWALNDEPHVITRGFSASAALYVIWGAGIGLDDAIVGRLVTVNRPTLSTVLESPYRRSQQTASAEDANDDSGFLFGIDWRPYWFEPLGERFAKTGAEIEASVKKTMQRLWPDWRSREDERRRTGRFRERETYHSHGSYPRTDDIHFYRSYHALMIVAGELLASSPPYQDPNYPSDGFEHWLEGHGLTRPDGRWLVDERDPEPLDWPTWRDIDEQVEWRSSLVRVFRRGHPAFG